MSGTSKPDMSSVVPIWDMAGDDDEDDRLLRECHEDARRFITTKSWCQEIRSEYFGMGVGGIIGVFLFEIEPAREDVADWNWCFYGDIPPAYHDTEDLPNPATALDCYIGALMEWVTAVREGHDTSDLIPVNVPDLPEWAEELYGRLEFLYKNILSEYAHDIRYCDDTVSGSDYFGKFDS